MNDVTNVTGGAIKDEGQKECEAAKIHVALGVELAGLDFETLCAQSSGTVRVVVSSYTSLFSPPFDWDLSGFQLTRQSDL